MRECGARKVLVTHGQDEALARYLREVEGIDAEPLGRLRPEEGPGEMAAAQDPWDAAAVPPRRADRVGRPRGSEGPNADAIGAEAASRRPPAANQSSRAS